MTTLDDLLDLFPDNTSGQISPADLRTAITELWYRVTTVVALPYDVAGGAAPGAGGIYAVGGWDAVTALEINDVATDATAMPWGVLAAPGVFLRVDRNDGQGSLLMDTTAAAVDHGGYGSVAARPRQITGTAPDPGDPVTLALLLQLETTP